MPFLHWKDDFSDEIRLVLLTASNKFIYVIINSAILLLKPTMKEYYDIPMIYITSCISLYYSINYGLSALANGIIERFGILNSFILITAVCSLSLSLIHI